MSKSAARLAVSRMSRRVTGPRVCDNSGFTLVELMVAVTIGLIILAAVSQIFATSHMSYRLEENLARVQEDGRFAMEFLSRDLRMAGFAGCVNVNQALNASAGYTANNGLRNTTPKDEYVFGPQTQVQGYEWTGPGTWNPPLPTFLGAGQVQDKSDVILIRRGDDTAYRVAAAVPAASKIVIGEPHDIEQGDIILIGDCTGVDVVKVTKVNSLGGTAELEHTAASGEGDNLSGSLSKDYDDKAEVMKLITRAYFVGDGAGGVPALKRIDVDKGIAGAPVELVEGIESMQIVYGEDTAPTNGSADVYELPTAVTDWSRVVSVRIGLLARTPNETGQDIDGKTYSLLGDAGTSDDYDDTADKNQRRMFNSTIQVRNMRTD
jgi:type IV pilus assembly protein PilW